MKAAILRRLFPMTAAYKISRVMQSFATPAKVFETFTRTYRDNLKEKK